MASLTAMNLQSSKAVRASSSNKVAAVTNISSLRVKPFTSASKAVFSAPKQSTLRTRVAETDAPAEAEVAETFEFNFADGKKNNDYTAGEVEAALNFYNNGEGSAPIHDGDHVTNELGMEDAALFEEIDNGDEDIDEYVTAGIPEAAPKQRRDRRNEEGGKEGAAEEEDSLDVRVQAKAIGKFQQAESEMVLRAQMEELYEQGDRDEESLAADTEAAPASWDWLADVDADEELLDTVASKANRIAAPTAALATDEQLFAELRSANFADVDLETKDTLDFLLDNFDIEGELKAIPDVDDEEVPEIGTVSKEDIARIDALLNTDIEEPTFDDSLLRDSNRLTDDGSELQDATVQAYLESLKGVQGEPMSDEQIKSMFGEDTPEKLVLEDVPIEPEFLAAVKDSKVADADDEDIVIEDEADEEDDMDDLLSELQSLQAMDATFKAPRADEIEVLDQYLTASEQYVASEEERKMQISQAVARGELPPEVLSEEYDEGHDVETELLMPDDDEEVEDEEEARDTEAWQERIIELTRVTKVVKGGKLMGFRCVAIVGNGKGLVGVGCQSGREVATAVKRALVDAKKSVVRVPLVGANTIPHKAEAKYHAARCVIVPAADGTGCLAGGSIRSVLELAGVQNVLAKRLGSRSPLNNARCTIQALNSTKSLQEVSKARGVPMERLLLPQ